VPPFGGLPATKAQQSPFFAIARKLAQLIYRFLRFGQDYIDIGDAAYEERFRVRRLSSMAQAAKQLGYALVPAPATT